MTVRDPVYLMALQAIVEQAYEERDRHDRNLAARIVDALAKSLNK